MTVKEKITIGLMFKITRQALQGWEKFKFLKPYFSYEEFAVFTIFFQRTLVTIYSCGNLLRSNWYKILQILFLTRDWSKRITWPNTPPTAKTGRYPRMSPKWYSSISNLTSTKISLCLQSNSRWESVLWFLQKRGNFFLHKVVPE